MEVQIRTREELKVLRQQRAASRRIALDGMPGPALGKRKRQTPPSTIRLRYDWETQTLKLSMDLSKKNLYGWEQP
jgi:hypothetical protein